MAANKRKKILRHGSPAILSGACILLTGWLLVLYEPLLFPIALQSGAGSFLLQPGYHLPIIGQCAIITGIGLILFGFAIQVMRILLKLAAANAARPLTSMLPDEQIASVAAAFDGNKHRMIPPVPTFAAGDQAREIITRGALNGRGYVLFRDGSVVVETLGGARRFGSITVAQEFIATE